MKNKITARPVSVVAFMMIMTVISKALGMLRSMLFASHYGIGPRAQAFSAASQIPLELFDLALGAAILGCFIPVYNSFKKEEAEQADDFARLFFNLILLASAALALFGILFAGPVISFMTPGLEGETKKLATLLLRIMFPMVIFTGSAYTLVGVMQSKGRYLLPAAVSAVSNAGVIVYLLFFDRSSGENGIYGLAAAYIASWFLQLMTLAVPLAASGFRFAPPRITDKPVAALKRALKAVPPIMLGSWLLPAGKLAGLYFASLLSVPGAVSVLDYTNIIFIIIAGTLTYSICNYAFPLLSRLSGEEGEWNRVVRNGIYASAAIIIPFSAAVYILAGEGVAVILMRGKFTAQDARETALALRCMTAGMPAFAAIEVLNRVFYSKGRVYVPMTAALCGIAVNIASSAVFVNIETLRVGAIGLGFAAGQTAAAAVLVISLIRLGGVINKKFVINIIKLLLAALCSFVLMAAVYKAVGNNPYQAGFIRNIITGAGVAAAGGAAYFAMIKLFRAAFYEA